jgi:serine/threonine protein kinase
MASSDLSIENMFPQETPLEEKPRKTYKISFSNGTYILGKIIGQGSVGKVKLARHEKTGELVSTENEDLQSKFLPDRS